MSKKFGVLLVLGLVAVLLGGIYLLKAARTNPEQDPDSSRTVEVEASLEEKSGGDAARERVRKRNLQILSRFLATAVMRQSTDNPPEKADVSPGPCAARVDRDGDGASESAEKIERDEHGRETVRHLDDDGDGQFDAKAETSYEGNTEIWTRTRNGQNWANVQKEYDDEGRIILAETDLPYDGEVDFATDYVYDGSGQLIETKRYSLGTLEATTSFQYENERLLSSSTVGRDGQAVSTTRFEYRQDGNLAREITRDATAEGPDVETRFEYDDANRLISKVTARSDAPDAPLMALSWQYDEAGDLIAENVDNDGDGQSDFSIQYDYECNPT